ncbi:MAG: hypothetical protein V4603_13290 [Pseudomonadota bacterium]
MKRLILKALVLATLVSQPLLAQAQDRYDRRSYDISELAWRSGPDRGRGHEIYFRYPGNRDWVRAPGAAFDVGDGWVLGTDRRNGGYGIYRWNGRDWQRMPGAAIDIGGSFRNPWVVNDRGERFHWSGSSWRQDSSYRRNGNNNGWNDNRRDDRRDERRDDGRRDDDRRGDDDRGDRDRDGDRNEDRDWGQRNR